MSLGSLNPYLLKSSNEKIFFLCCSVVDISLVTNSSFFMAVVILSR